MTADKAVPPVAHATAPWKASLDIVLVVAVFALYAGWPVPEPNEPHYLAKARHYWNPAWLAGDFFLDSADSHTAFYLSAGWLTQLLPLPAVALLGRAFTWLMLAMAWRRLSIAIVPVRGAAVVSALLFVGLCENFHLAGEWVVGGFEAKGIAYALVLLGLAEMARGHWNAAWLWTGAGAMFHVLVGGWAAIALGACWLASRGDRPRLASMGPGLLAAAALTLPGVLQGLALNRDAEPAVISAANEIYVYQRLTHHLSFFDIRVDFIRRFAILAAAWALLWFWGPSDDGARRVGRIVWASLALVLIGVALGTLGHFRPDLAARWLRFYWFRLADALVPLGVAMWGTSLACRAVTRYGRRGYVLPALLVACGVAMLWPTVAARLHATTPRADKRGKVRDYTEWREACRWIAENTPADARFLTPRSAQTFKWYADRSEVVTWKDMPQDAAGIVAWWDRLREIHGTGDEHDPWHDSLAQLEAHRLRALGQKYQAGFVVTEAEPEVDLPRVYRNGTYAVYDLRFH